jgi:prepilin-type N-terminal cleavage/methylation domain-containing protein
MKGRNGQGFTIIEMAIVLVIIGLILGAVLKLTAVRQSAQAKDVITMAGDISAAVSSFKENYKYLPGDFPAAPGEIANLLAGSACVTGGANAGNGDGAINANESACVPEHLFRAGMTKAEIDPATGLYIFKSPFGSVTVISAALSKAGLASPTALPATTQNVIEFTNLPCDVALEIDQKMDNAALTTGNAVAVDNTPSIITCTPGGANDPVPFFDISL